MSKVAQLDEKQRHRLAGHPVWLSMRAGDVLQWRRDLMTGAATVTQAANRDDAINLMMRQCVNQLGDIPLNSRSDQTVRFFVTLPISLDRIDDLTADGTPRSSVEMALMICDAISLSLMEIDWLPVQCVAELEGAQTEIRATIEELLRSGDLQ